MSSFPTGLGHLYAPLRQIGQGGSATVYLARQAALDRTVVLKLIQRGALARPDDVPRILEEARLLVELRHPHVVELLDFGECEDGLYLVYPDEGGATLADTSPPEGTWPVPAVVRVLGQVLDGLAFMHEAGVLHRDLKPANVLLTKEGDVRILDFGLAKDAGGELALTESGVFLGTPLYGSPQRFGGEPAVPQDDLYALGVLAYELLTGTNPFRSGGLGETVHRHRYLVPTPAEAVRAEVGPSLSAWVDALLEKETSARPDSAEAAAAALRACAEERTDSRPSPGPSTGRSPGLRDAPEDSRRPPRGPAPRPMVQGIDRRRGAMAAALMGLFVLGLVGARALRSSVDARPTAPPSPEVVAPSPPAARISWTRDQLAEAGIEVPRTIPAVQVGPTLDDALARLAALQARRRQLVRSMEDFLATRNPEGLPAALRLPALVLHTLEDEAFGRNQASRWVRLAFDFSKRGGDVPGELADDAAALRDAFRGLDAAAAEPADRALAGVAACEVYQSLEEIFAIPGPPLEELRDDLVVAVWEMGQRRERTWGTQLVSTPAPAPETERRLFRAAQGPTEDALARGRVRSALLMLLLEFPKGAPPRRHLELLERGWSALAGLAEGPRARILLRIAEAIDPVPEDDGLPGLVRLRGALPGAREYLVTRTGQAVDAEVVRRVMGADAGAP
jgi:serine/threonine-protein kinase